MSHCHQGCVSSLSCSTRFDPVNSFVLPSWVSQGGTPDNFRPTLNSASELSLAVQNKGFNLHDHVLRCVSFFLFSCVVLVFLLFFLFSFFFFSVSFLCCAFCFLSCGASFPFVLLAVSWLNLRSLLPSCGTLPLMDHAQARAFHHHLARALMHLNYLAGLLPFFEPSIEWEDSLPPQNLCLDNMRSRSLHTFVPLPPSSAPPTLVTHGGIPSHMVENPEPNLRPTIFRPPSHMEREHPSINFAGTHSPVLMTDPNPNPDNPSSIPSGREISRNTIPVPVRSKQRVSSTIDHTTKEASKKHPTLWILPYPGNMTIQLPLHFRFPPTLLSMHSILMILMVMAHQQPPQFTRLILILLLVMSLPLTLPFLLVLPPLR